MDSYWNKKSQQFSVHKGCTVSSPVKLSVLICILLYMEGLPYWIYSNLWNTETLAAFKTTYDTISTYWCDKCSRQYVVCKQKSCHSDLENTSGMHLTSLLCPTMQRAGSFTTAGHFWSGGLHGGDFEQRLKAVVNFAPRLFNMLLNQVWMIVQVRL